MTSSAQSFGPSEAARRLGVSVKALRLYEKRGLLTPVRSGAGWRAYGQKEMTRAAEIVALRELGLSLAQVVRVLAGKTLGLEPVLAAQEARLEGETRRLAALLERIRALRAALAKGEAPPAIATLSHLLRPAQEARVGFELPWPWGGEHFELRDIRPLNYIIGPLGSGKTRFARRLAESLPGAAFLGLDRAADGGTTARARLDADPHLGARVDRTLAALVKNGATTSDALIALLMNLEAEASALLVIDMLEQGLDEATQRALIARLRARGPEARSIFLLTRSRAILDLAAVSAWEAIILCPANHSPPRYVAPYPGAPGYEAVATCLASPQVRARTEGVIAWRPKVA
ncbi:MAG: MerR family transcriptional regulator [Hyphomicrobiales bacterium]|nr:MerR family transcriptional regulator [Hyphomicrobiales bacterium]